jgi:hypothetical protein
MRTSIEIQLFWFTGRQNFIWLYTQINQIPVEQKAINRNRYLLLLLATTGLGGLGRGRRSLAVFLRRLIWEKKLQKFRDKTKESKNKKNQTEIRLESDNRTIVTMRFELCFGVSSRAGNKRDDGARSIKAWMFIWVGYY